MSTQTKGRFRDENYPRSNRRFLGIRIPKAFLEECRLDDQAELELRHAHLVIRPAQTAPERLGRRLSPRMNTGMMHFSMTSLSVAEWNATE